jgi:hypothetical protein
MNKVVLTGIVLSSLEILFFVLLFIFALVQKNKSNKNK